jgi:hypothetical protein
MAAPSSSSPRSPVIAGAVQWGNNTILTDGDKSMPLCGDMVSDPNRLRNFIAATLHAPNARSNVLRVVRDQIRIARDKGQRSFVYATTHPGTEEVIMAKVFPASELRTVDGGRLANDKMFCNYVNEQDPTKHIAIYVDIGGGFQASVISNDESYVSEWNPLPSGSA